MPRATTAGDTTAGSRRLGMNSKGVFRNSIVAAELELISDNYLCNQEDERMNGGGCSLERTALWSNFPLTGKNTGIFRVFVLKLSGLNGYISLNTGNLSLAGFERWLHKIGN
jgi:hypothetical protein